MVKKIEDTITRFDRMYERDRQTDGYRMTAQAAKIAIFDQCLASSPAMYLFLVACVMVFVTVGLRENGSL